MGICTCKKRTDYFCFDHKKSVCEDCIVNDHYTCVVKTYRQWLEDSEFEPASCVVCKGHLSKGSIRLKCFHLVHPECLDVYASSLPPNTARAGYKCPLCDACFLPERDHTHAIDSALYQFCSKTRWGSPFYLPQVSDAATESGNQSGNTPPNVGSMFTRVSTRKPSAVMMDVSDDLEEDKYQKTTDSLSSFSRYASRFLLSLRSGSRRTLAVLFLFLFVIFLVAYALSSSSGVDDTSSDGLGAASVPELDETTNRLM